MYLWNLLSLWAARKISFSTLCAAIKTRSIVVEGADRAYVVDCAFQPSKPRCHGTPALTTIQLQQFGTRARK